MGDVYHRCWEEYQWAFAVVLQVRVFITQLIETIVIGELVKNFHRGLLIARASQFAILLQYFLNLSSRASEAITNITEFKLIVDSVDLQLSLLINDAPERPY